MQRVTLKGDILNQVIFPVLKNSCLKAHCKNKATCQTGFTDKGYHCLCTVGFKGEYCEIGKYLICGTACLTAVNNGDSNATGRQEEKDSKTLVCDKRDRVITCLFCRELYLKVLCHEIQPNKEITKCPLN